MKIKILIGVLLLVVSCNKNDNNIRKLEILKDSISKLSDGTYLVSIRDMQMHDEFLYLSDYEANRIIVLDSNFNIKRSFGRSGAGPGEFKGAGYMQFFNDSIYVISAGKKIMNIYDNKGIFKRSFFLDPTIWGSSRFVIDKFERFYFSSPNNKNFPIIKCNNNGKLVKGFGKWWSYLNLKEKLAKNEMDLFLYNNKILVITHGSPVIKIYSLNGKFLDSFSLESNPFVKKRLRFAKKELSKSHSKRISIYELFWYGLVHNGKLYLLTVDFDKSLGTGQNKILVINIKNKTVINTFLLQPNGWYDSFTITGNKLIAFKAGQYSELQIFSIK